MQRLILFLATIWQSLAASGNPAKTLASAETRYGKLYWDYTWERKSEFLVPFQLKGVRVHVNKDMLIPLTLVMAELENLGLDGEIKKIDGCYNPRSVRGKHYPSVHAYGLGCDFNAYMGQTTFSDRFVQVWEKWGFCWGGNFNDNMHFSYAWECTKGEEAYVE